MPLPSRGATMTVTGGHRAQDRRWRRLIRRYQAGDRAAGEQLVAEALPSIRALARHYGRSGDRDDLVQAGLLGLTKAIGAYRTGQGASVHAYLLPCVVGEMRRHLRDHGWAVHVPRRLQETALAVSRGVEELTASLGRAPKVSELAAALGLSDEMVLEGLAAGQAYRAGSLEAPASPGPNQPTVEERLGAPDAALAWAESRTFLRQIRGRLDERERLVLSLRFDADLTQVEIARRVGCSQMQVSRVLRAALEKVRAHAALAA